MVMLILILVFSIAARSLADDFQSILTQISAGNNECNEKKLFGGFDFKTVPQFNALCNIPIPDVEQSKFLLENNVVPILCMGLMDVSLRLCKAAKIDVSPFSDIFPPTTAKFEKTFHIISNFNNFSSIHEFCSITVKHFTVKEAASNVTEPWWKVLNNQFIDEKNCLDICHSNDNNKVHPLCSYIVWSNGVFINYQNSQVKSTEQGGIVMGEDQPHPMVQKPDEPDFDQRVKSNQDIVDKNLSIIATEPVIHSDNTPSIDSIDEKNQIFSTDNIVGVETKKQVLNTGVVTIGTVTANANVNRPKGIGELDKATISKSIPKTMEIETTLNSTINLNSGANNINQEKPVHSADQIKVKDGIKKSAVEVPSKSPEPQDNGEVETSIASEDQKEQGFELGETTPNEESINQNILSGKDPYSVPEEDAQDEDDDDVNIDSNGPVNTNTANNGKNIVASNPGGIIQQSPVEGDKVYGEAGVLFQERYIEAEDSHFFTYFLCVSVLTIMSYIAFHNKKKLIALAVEGRRTKGGRRRPNSSHYSKLDCSLEEALVSNTTASVTHVLY